MRKLFFIFIAALAISARAQSNETAKVSLISPTDFQVLQREKKSAGTIVVEGILETSTNNLVKPDKLEVRFTGKSLDGDLPDNWRSLPMNPHIPHFRAALQAPAGGWYRLELRLSGGGQTVFETNVEHVGVGEIFVIAGQSNSANHGEEKQKPKSPLVVAFGNGRWQPAGDPEPGASGKKGSFMPAFGDAMAEKFNVPIGIVAIGEGSTSVREWLPKNDAMILPPTTGKNTILTSSNSWVSAGDLFNRIISAQQMLGADGFRALLWHQGESDSHQPVANEISPAIYRQYLQRVIESSRAAAGWRVPWFVAQVSYHNPEDTSTPELRAAQKSLVTDGIALAGPDTDTLGSEFREKNG
ncbi:MAG TPA: sialate O-acetylesterase, partial [Verrucomicrobiae bacterium]|nr:sialate O-acetylesterase [Verrucomicrobiae bacterium]